MNDLISRRQAVDAIKPYMITDGFYDMDENVQGFNDGISCAIRALSELPSAQLEQQWIPCSERLPENGRQVLVYAISTHFALAKYDEMREADGSYIKQWVTFDAWKPFYRVKDVIAWMELPEPCKR